MTHLYVEGLNGQVEVDDEWVRIHRKGLMARAGHGMLGRGVQIRLSDIVDIDISYPRFGVNGYIRFLTGGEHPIGVQEAVKDDASVVFKKKHQAAFDELREELKALLAERSDKGLAQAIAAAVPRVDFATQIRELAALRDEGLLSEEEFQLKKAQLLRDR